MFHSSVQQIPNDIKSNIIVSIHSNLLKAVDALGKRIYLFIHVIYGNRNTLIESKGSTEVLFQSTELLL
jgi:hypothetical protein